MVKDVSSNFEKVMNVLSWTTCLVAAVTLMLGLFGSESAQATTGGSPYEVPQVVDVNPAGNIVETYLVADEATVNIDNGVSITNALTFKSCASFDVCEGVVGTIPGPEFRLKVGDTVLVHFQNKLNKEVTGIHWHGVELNNASDGTPLTQAQLKPGQKFDYKFTVTRPGIFWYHPHHHSSTNQVFQGLYGSLIVTETLDANLQGTVLPSAAQTKTLVLSDITVCKAPGTNDAATYDTSTLPHVSGSWSGTWAGKTPKVLCDEFPVDEEGNLRSVFKAGEVPNIMTGPPVGEGQTVLTNGVNVGARTGTPESPGVLASGARTLAVTAGQGLRLQVINSSATRYVRLHLTDGTGQQVNLVRIGGQGGLLDQARLEGDTSTSVFKFNYKEGQILIPPGSRQDVVAVIPSGLAIDHILTLWTEDFQRAGGLNSYAWIPTVPAMHLKVAGQGGTYTIANGTPLRPAGDLVKELLPLQGSLLAQGMGSPITFTNSGGQLGVNDIQGDHDHSTLPASARFAQIGDTLELTVTNETGAHHPFHLHGFSIQPVSLSKPGALPYSYGYHEFVDELDIPSKHTLTFRVRLDDRPNFYNAKGKVLENATPTGGGLGRWLFHCHILFHATLGMISELDVVAAPTP
ncbi:MAG: multicopper oxidase family protein [Nitrospira sp.]|nr:multicopper oxidase family protein [Nitrospira sp.]